MSIGYFIYQDRIRDVPEDHISKAQEAITAPPSVAFLVSRLGFEVSSQLADGLAPLGIEPRHFGLLRALMISEGQTQRAIGQVLNLHPNRMVALVDDLENLGLVQRRPQPGDRRAHALMLTPEGTSVLQKAFQVAIDVENALCSDLDPGERTQILGLLGRLRHHDPSRPGVHPGLSGQPFRGSSRPPDDPDAGGQSQEA
jgi:DNA-binding MarR family transcriptional regulator